MSGVGGPTIPLFHEGIVFPVMFLVLVITVKTGKNLSGMDTIFK